MESQCKEEECRNCWEQHCEKCCVTVGIKLLFFPSTRRNLAKKNRVGRFEYLGKWQNSVMMHSFNEQNLRSIIQDYGNRRYVDQIFAMSTYMGERKITTYFNRLGFWNDLSKYGVEI